MINKETPKYVGQIRDAIKKNVSAFNFVIF